VRAQLVTLSNSLQHDVFYVMQTNKMPPFQINVLIQFLVSATCFEHLVFITSKTICTCSFMVYFSCISVSSLARLLTEMHEKHQKKTPRIEWKH